MEKMNTLVKGVQPVVQSHRYLISPFFGYHEDSFRCSSFIHMVYIPTHI